MIMEEIWKDIKDYEGIFEVSNFGNVVRILDSGEKRKLNGSFDARHGRVFNLKVSGITIRRSKHILVATHFMGYKKDGNKLCVIFKDGNKDNCSTKNIKIVSSRDNLAMYQRERNNNRSKYVGVGYNKKQEKYEASIYFNSSHVSLGKYEDEKDAHKFYQLAKKHIDNYEKERRGLLNKIEKNKIIPAKVSV